MSWLVDSALTSVSSRNIDSGIWSGCDVPRDDGPPYANDSPYGNDFNTVGGCANSHATRLVSALSIYSFSKSSNTRVGVSRCLGF